MNNNNIFIKEDHFYNREQLIEEVKGKKIHLACEANEKPESTCRNLLTRFLEGKDLENSLTSLLKVNKLEQAGSLYPKANITIYPSYIYSIQQNKKRMEKDMFELIFEANEKYLKTKTLVILIEKKDDVPFFYNAIKQIVSDYSPKVTWLKNIILVTTLLP